MLCHYVSFVNIIYYPEYKQAVPGCGVVSDGPGGDPPGVVDWPGCDSDGVGDVPVKTIFIRNTDSCTYTLICQSKEKKTNRDYRTHKDIIKKGTSHDGGRFGTK